MKEVHEKQKIDKASGIDRVTKRIYGENLEENLQLQTTTGKKNLYLEKEGRNEMRPLGILAYENRLVHGVIAELLNTIYEPKFYDFSYGFREARDCHMAIKHLDGILIGKTGWVVDADIKNSLGT